jgi:4-carboxymuconolactone decarboxylase
MFPGSASTLAATDPDLAGVLDSFLAEVKAHASLDPVIRFVTLLGALIACQAASPYRATLGAAFDAGVTPVQAKEVVYQAVPYVGLAKIADFIDATNEVLVARGVELPLPSQSTTTPETRTAKGYAVQAEIIGRKRIEGLYANAPADEMHIQRHLSANCFGDNYTRTGLDIRQRELLTLSILAAHGGCDPQVRGHVAANLNVGNDRALMIEVVTQLLPFIGYPRTLNALVAVDAVAPSPGKEKAGNA